MNNYIINLHTIEYNSHKTNYSIGNHLHNYFELVYYVNGTGTIVINDKKFDFKPNSYSITRPQSEHREHSQTITNLLYIGFSLNDDVDSSFLENGIYQATKDDHILSTLKEILFERDNKGFYYKEQIDYLLNYLFNLLKRNIEKLENKSIEMKNVIQYIKENCNKNLDAKKVAKYFSYNYDYFRKEFKKYYNITLSDYINNERLEYSKKLLRTTHLSINEIAKKCGYSSTSHFISCFKNHYKITPKKYLIGDVKL